MKEFYNQLIDIALDHRDFEWVKKLVKEREESTNNISTNKLIYPKAKALEDLHYNYVVKENHGLRNIIMSSEDDIINSEIVQIKNCQYEAQNDLYAKQNSDVEYETYDSSSQIVLKYYLKGWKEGVKYGFDIGKLNISINNSNKMILDIMNRYGIKN